jgi:hypothetical protein
MPFSIKCLFTPIQIEAIEEHTVKFSFLSLPINTREPSRGRLFLQRDMSNVEDTLRVTNAFVFSIDRGEQVVCLDKSDPNFHSSYTPALDESHCDQYMTYLQRDSRKEHVFSYSDNHVKLYLTRKPSPEDIIEIAGLFDIKLRAPATEVINKHGILRCLINMLEMIGKGFDGFTNEECLWKIYDKLIWNDRCIHFLTELLHCVCKGNYMPRSISDIFVTNVSGQRRVCHSFLLIFNPPICHLFFSLTGFFTSSSFSTILCPSHVYFSASIWFHVVRCCCSSPGSNGCSTR